MNVGKFGEKFYAITEYVMQLAYINLLWILFTLLGFGIFGLFPSTAALFAVTNEWVTEQKNTKVFSSFWRHYRIYFTRANMLGYVMIVIGVFLWLDLRLCTYYGGIFFELLGFAILGIALLYIISFIYLFPVCIRFQTSPFMTLKYALYSAVTHPIESLMMMLCITLIFIASNYFASIIPFFSFSCIGFVVTWLTTKVFPGVQKDTYEERASLD